MTIGPGSRAVRTEATGDAAPHAPAARAGATRVHPRERRWMAGAAVVFLLAQLSQLAGTPIGEGMDVYGHLGYVAFVAREGRPPRPEEASLPQSIARVRDACLAPDYLCPAVYARWRALDPDSRDARRALLTPSGPDPYVERNYQAQHPPLFYAVASVADRPVADARLDQRIRWLASVGLVMAAAGLPFLYLAFRRVLSPQAALLLLLIVAWFPNLMPFLGRVTNDALAFPLACALVWMVGGPVTRARIALGTAVLAIGFFTKTYFLAMAPGFLLWAAFAGGPSPARRAFRFDWRSLVAACLGVAVAGAAFAAFNIAATGHVVPLVEMQRTASLSLWTKISALFSVDPIWFVAGVARNFFWSGYWSFVSPHLLYYAPLAIVLVALVRLPHAIRIPDVRDQLWPQAALVVGFLAGLWWHAALFTLDARLRGATVHSGNEGWYLNVLIGSAALVVLLPIAARTSEARLSQLLSRALVVTVVWNLAARLVMIGFWGGGSELVGRARLVRPSQLGPALLDPDTWRAWASWPGVFHPVATAIALPLACAVIGTVWLARARSEHEAERTA